MTVYSINSEKLLKCFLTNLQMKLRYTTKGRNLGKVFEKTYVLCVLYGKFQSFMSCQRQNGLIYII